MTTLEPLKPVSAPSSTDSSASPAGRFGFFRRTSPLLRNVLFRAVLTGWLLHYSIDIPVAAQTTAFTYQGRLATTNGPGNGFYDFTFTLYGTNSGGNALTATATSGVPVSNSLFNVEVDFLSAAWFDGEKRWLELTVRTNGGVEAPVVLSPRQEITSTPYALRAAEAETASTAAWGGLTGLPAGFADGVDNDTTYLAGAGLSLLGGVFSLNTNFTHGVYWRLTGNEGTTAGINFLGTTDDEPLELKVNGRRVLRLEPNAAMAPNLIGGASSNYVAPGVVGATIGGGGALDYLGLGNVESNSVFSDFGTIGGGWSNVIRTAATSSTIGGGYGNVSTFPETTVGGGVGNQTTGTGATIGGGRNNRAGGDWGTVAGGSGNTAGGIQSAVAGGSGNEAFAWWSAIGGGSGNTADGTARYSVVAGGEDNTIALEHATIGGGLQNTNIGYYSAIGGGRRNLIEVLADYSVIPGGRDNTVDADYALAGGRRAAALHNGSFVWGDSTDADFVSIVANEFAVRASGGARVIGSPTNALLMVGPNETLDGDDSQLLLAEDHDGTFGVALNYDGGVNQFQLYGKSFGSLSGPHLVITRDSGNVGIKRSPTANDLEVEGTASKTAAGSWLANSDARIKQDIQPVTGALETLEQVRLVSFRYTDAYRSEHPSVEERRYLNVIAQEFAEVFPDDVKGSGETLADGSEILQVDTYPLTIYSVAAVQELNRKLEQNETEIQELRQALTNLRQLVEGMNPD